MFYSLALYVGEASNYQDRMKHFALPPLTQSSERENKYTILLLISVFVILVVANGLGSDYIVDWSDVEKIAVYDEYATLGSIVTIEYYLVNDRPTDVKVENIPPFTTSILWSSEPNDEKRMTHSPPKYISIPASDSVSCGSETIHIKKMGYVVVQNTGFPDVRIDVVEKFETLFNVNIGLNEYVFDSQDVAKLVIENGDSHEITYGSPYIIEMQIEGEWVEVSPFPPNSAWTAELRICPAGGTTTQKIKIDTLGSGHYRVSKTINHERTKMELTFILEFDILPEYSYVMEMNSEPHLVKGGNCYYTIDITILNRGMPDINVKLENVRICDITYLNMTVDVRGYDIIPDYAEYVLVPVNSTQSIRYVTGEVVQGSISYVRIEFTLHIHELDKVEIISTWLHRKLVTS